MKVLVGVLVVLVAVLQWRLWFGDGSVQEVWRLHEEVRNSRAELTRLSMRNQALAAEVADLKSGLDAIEERARSDLGMVAEGETFFQFVREKRLNANRSVLLPISPDQDPDPDADADADPDSLSDPIPRSLPDSVREENDNSGVESEDVQLEAAKP